MGISPPECLVSSLLARSPGSVVEGVASGSMDDPLPNRSTALGLPGLDPEVLGPFNTSREPLFLPLPISFGFRGQRNSGRRLGLESGLGLGLGLTDPDVAEVSGSELAPLLLFSLRPRIRLGFRNSGEDGALLHDSTASGSEMAIDMGAMAEVWANVFAACFFLCFPFSFFSFLSFLLPGTGTGSETIHTTGVSPTGERSFFSAMVFIRSGSGGSGRSTRDMKSWCLATTS